MRLLLPLLLACLAFALPGVAQEAMTEDVSSTEIPVAPYFAGVTALDNAGRLLPALDYWGASGAQWGESPVAVEEAAMAAPPCSVAGQTCASASSFDAGERLASITYSFAQGVAERRERLAVFLKLQDELVATYGAPSVNVSPVEQVRGEDAYVQGLDAGYELQWIGPETIVRLALSDDQLLIDLERAPAGNAAQHELDYEAFEQIRAALPADHPLNKIGTPN